MSLLFFVSWKEFTQHRFHCDNTGGVTDMLRVIVITFKTFVVLIDGLNFDSTTFGAQDSVDLLFRPGENVLRTRTDVRFAASIKNCVDETHWLRLSQPISARLCLSLDVISEGLIDED